MEAFKAADRAFEASMNEIQQQRRELSLLLDQAALQARRAKKQVQQELPAPKKKIGPSPLRKSVKGGRKLKSRTQKLKSRTQKLKSRTQKLKSRTQKSKSRKFKGRR